MRVGSVRRLLNSAKLNPWLSGANEKRIARNSLRPPQIAILGNETLSDPTRNVDLEG